MTDYFNAAGRWMSELAGKMAPPEHGSGPPSLPPEVREASAASANRIGKFIKVSLIARGGGSGGVFRAWDVPLGRWVALKFPRLQDPRDRERFLREARMAARLDHPNIVQIREVIDEPEHLLIAMQLIDGTPPEPGRIPPRRSAEIMRDVCGAVAYAHRQGIIHRDLKPQNILVDRDGRPYVVDFGLAKELRPGTSLTLTGLVHGTPAYMSPQQARGERLDERSDVYSLGATLYEWVTGRPPFDGESITEILKKVTDEDPIAPRRLNPKLERDLETIISKAMEKEPGRRYATVEGMAEDLSRFLAGETIVARPASRLYRLKKRIQRQPVVWGLSALLAVLGVAFGVYAIVQQEDARTREKALKRLSVLGNNLVQAQQGILNPIAKPDRIRADVRSVIDEVTEYIHAHPAHPQGYHVRANGRLFLNELSEAEADLQEAVRIEPTFGPGWALLVRVYYSRYLSKLYGAGAGKRKERIETAHRYLDRALEAMKQTRGEGGPTAWSERWGLARTKEDKVTETLVTALLQQHSTGDTKKAIQILEQAYRSDPTQDYCFWLAVLHTDRKTSISWCDRAIQIAPHHARAYAHRGGMRFAEGDWEEAIADHTRALEIDPRFAEAWANRGMIRRKQGDRLAGKRRAEDARVEWDMAIEDCTRALELDPQLAVAYDVRAGARLGTGEFKEAIADLDSLLEITPDHWGGFNNRGNAHRMIGDQQARRGDSEAARTSWESAADNYTQAVTHNPKYAEAFHNRGQVREKLGDLEGAIADYDRRIELTPKLKSPYLSRGIARRVRGNQLAREEEFNQAGVLWEQAIADFTRAIDIDPGFPEAYANRGMLQGQLGNQQAAIGRQEEAVAKWEAAVSDLRKALDVAPKGWSGRKITEQNLRRASESLRLGSEF